MKPLFTEAEEQKYQEIGAKSRFHYEERAKLLPQVLYYREWKSELRLPNREHLNPFTPEEEKMYQEMSEQVRYHSKEIEKCQMALGPYRDLKNVSHTRARKAIGKAC